MEFFGYLKQVHRGEICQRDMVTGKMFIADFPVGRQLGFLDEGLGRSRGGLSSKIHCVVDGLGNPVDFILTGGEVHDNVCADALLDGKKAAFVIADKAYDSNKTLDKIAQMEATAVIPPN